MESGQQWRVHFKYSFCHRQYSRMILIFGWLASAAAAQTYYLFRFVSTTCNVSVRFLHSFAQHKLFLSVFSSSSVFFVLCFGVYYYDDANTISWPIIRNKTNRCKKKCEQIFFFLISCFCLEIIFHEILCALKMVQPLLLRMSVEKWPKHDSTLCNKVNTHKPTHTHTGYSISQRYEYTTRNPEPRKVNRFSLTQWHTTDTDRYFSWNTYARYHGNKKNNRQTMEKRIHQTHRIKI